MITSDRYTFSSENVNKAPKLAGVYALFQGDELIYYGRATGGAVTIRSRLQAHLSGREGPCTKSATTYMRETCSNSVERERQLLIDFRGKNARLPRCNDRVG